MSTPTERVTEYLRQFDRLRDTGGVIHRVHTDPEAEEGALTSADLHILLAALPPVTDWRQIARDHLAVSNGDEAALARMKARVLGGSGDDLDAEAMDMLIEEERLGLRRDDS